MKGPSSGTAKWRSKRGKKEGEREREKKGKIIDVRRKERDREADSEEGGRGQGCTRMRKVDSEVYTVRRDLINPPKLLSLLPLGLALSLSLSHGRTRYVRRRLCALSRAGQVSSNGLFRPKWKALSFLYDRQSISRSRARALYSYRTPG